MAKDNQVLVFNGFTELRLPFDGRVFKFPFNKTTAVDDLYCSAPDERRRNHESDPVDNAILERTYPARTVADMLLSRHGQNLVGDGCVLILDREPTDAEKARAIEMGRIRKANMVGEAIAEHNAAKTQPGAKHFLDAEIIHWMKELDITDDIYNPAAKVDQGAVIAELLAKILQAQAPKPELAGARK